MKLVDSIKERFRPKRSPPINFTRGLNAKKRQRLEEILKAIDANPGCSQKTIVEYTGSNTRTVGRDVRALERRALVTVARPEGVCKNYEHQLTIAGENYIKNLK